MKFLFLKHSVTNDCIKCINPAQICFIEYDTKTVHFSNGTKMVFDNNFTFDELTTYLEHVENI